MKRVLVVRLGAYGDCLIVSPLLKHLKKTGHKVYVLTSEQGVDIYANNPNIDEIIYHPRNSVGCEHLGEYFKAVQKAHECDILFDLCETVECNLCMHPYDPAYNWSKAERLVKCNKNYYDHTFAYCGFDEEKGHLPEMFFTEKEEQASAEIRQENFLGKFVVVWCLSGSSMNKAYPYTHLVMKEVLKQHKNVVFVTVGDDQCVLLEESLPKNSIYPLCGETTFRESVMIAKYADLVVSPDTGMLHAAGCFDTPKIGLLNHTTVENITKYFKNDYSIEAVSPCAPCFRLVYNTPVQCPVDPETEAPWCMAFGFGTDGLWLVDQINRVYDCAVKEKGLINA